jgi:F-type H+-transporting ATPase subunit gamma
VHFRIFSHISIETGELVGRDIIGDYTAKSLDAVYVIYNEFKSAIRQDVVIEQLLPIVPNEPDKSEEDTLVDFIYEPSRDQILRHILPLDIHVQLYRIFLESFAAEMGARMTAMENATNNAEDLIKSLTLQYNKLRQAAITKELMEITGGVEALKG